MMHGRGKSDSAVVAVKLANEAERSAEESVEPRTETKGNASQQGTCRAQYRASVSQALESIRPAAAADGRHHPRWEPYAGKPHVRIYAGGARQLASLPRRKVDTGFP
jgi:hypothetical protein